MLMKVSELNGRGLNYAVAVCSWGEPVLSNDVGWVWNNCEGIYRNPNHEFRHLDFNPSGNWSHGGPTNWSSDNYQKPVKTRSIFY